MHSVIHPLIFVILPIFREQPPREYPGQTEPLDICPQMVSINKQWTNSNDDQIQRELIIVAIEVL